jgi:hypothetical protein
VNSVENTIGIWSKIIPQIEIPSPIVQKPVKEGFGFLSLILSNNIGSSDAFEKIDF